jgi:DNA-binding MarR family transcriptional regulator
MFEIAMAIKALQRSLERAANEAMRPLGLTGAQADALAVIGQAGSISLKELGELLIAEGGHPSRLVDRLFEARLVERRPADDDRRRVVLSLTPAGRRMNKRAEAMRETQLDFFRQILGDRDLASELELVLELLKYTPYADLVDRRRTLLERSAARRRGKKRSAGFGR